MNQRALLPLIEAAAVRGWPAREAVIVDGWLFRHSSGGSTRANSVATLTFTGQDPDAAIDAVEAMANARGRAACFTVSDVSQPDDLDARLHARGYDAGPLHVTMAKAVDQTIAMPAGVVCAKAFAPEWLAVYLSGLSADRQSTAPAILARLPASAVFVSAETGGSVISSGLTIGDGVVASIQCMATRPDARRGGGAGRVLAAIEYLAGRDGRTALYLQTAGDNVAARALYHRAGFSEIGSYHTRTQARGRSMVP